MTEFTTLVVVPVFNRASIVSQTLDSIAKQTLRPDIVVLVDDGSTDNTLEVIEAWKNEHSNIDLRILPTSNQGASKARNLAVASTNESVDFVAFLDSDDCWPCDFLARSVAALTADPSAVATSTDREFVSVDTQFRKFQSLQDLAIQPLLWFFRNDAGIGSCSLFRFNNLQLAGGYPEHIPTGHDVVLFGRIAVQGKWLHLPGSPTMFSRSSGASGSAHGGHLHQRYPDYLTWWAKAFQELWIMAPQELQALPEVRQTLGKRWRHAGRNALLRRDLREARDCLRKASALHPWSPKIWALQVKLSLLQFGDQHVI
jgi:hypothetical protein